MILSVLPRFRRLLFVPAIVAENPFSRELFSVLLLLIVGLVTTGTAHAKTKVAFIGDQGVGEHARSVLSLVRDEGTDLLMIQGDLGYERDSAGRWENNLTDYLGADFPVLIVVGNHENFEWPLYQHLAKQRIDRASSLSCSGDVGVKAFCQFDNLDIVQIAAGVTEVSGVKPDDNYAGYIRSSLAASNGRWRICSWHKNQRNMQTGNKGDATGWEIYRSCLDAGAMIALAHEHAYSRTFLMSDYENLRVAHRDSHMVLEPGRSFAFVSGLGGREVRSQQRGGDWWASIYTATQGASHGALFCDFEDTTAACYFKSINGAVPDTFTLELRSASPAPGAGNTTPVTQQVADTGGSNTPTPPFVFSRTDTEEHRYIDYASDGQLGSIWISRECAGRFGGVRSSGDWGELMKIAPAFDRAPYPCDGASNDVAAQVSPPPPSGYVFSRTDKDELRWIAPSASGDMGSTWIDSSCAQKMGGASASGDWMDLIIEAPAFDAVESPC